MLKLLLTTPRVTTRIVGIIGSPGVGKKTLIASIKPSSNNNKLMVLILLEEENKSQDTVVEKRMEKESTHSISERSLHSPAQSPVAIKRVSSFGSPQLKLMAKKPSTPKIGAI
jgi:predicted ATP-dependent serine protease